MLKVVGASWLKTRIGTYIVAGAGLLAVGSLFLADMERPTYDGTYCATIYWTQQTGFRVEFWGQQNDLQKIPKGVARTCYKDSTCDNGWSKIEIETQPMYPDWVQSFAAGMLEGALTWQGIHNHWKNTIESYCDKDEQSQRFCKWLRVTISNNVNTIKSLANERGKHDHYWYQIRLFYYQLEGLEHGWHYGVQRSRVELELNTVDFLLLNAASDIRDLRVYFERIINVSDEYRAPTPKASMLLNFLSANNSIKKILVGHSSDGSYSSMLRMLKKYKFHFHYSHDHKTPEVSGIDIAFTGYPGCIASHDDFYMIRGKKTKLTVGGIQIQNNNTNLWRNVDVDNSVLLAARVMAANRLAHSGRSWAKIISRNPGFGVKQWFVIDVKRLHRYNNHTAATNQTEMQMDANGLNTIGAAGGTDQNGNGTLDVDVAGTERRDVTDVITETGAEASKDINGPKHLLWIIDQLPGRLHAEDKTQDIAYGTGFWKSNGFPYFNEMIEASQVQIDAPGGKPFYASNITDLDAVAKVLRSRAYRGDLMGDKPSAYGNIDIKLYSETNEAEMEFHALAGPIFYNTDNYHHINNYNNNKNNNNNNNNINNNNNNNNKNNIQNEKILHDDNIPSVSNDQLSEIEIISERRAVRDDIRAVALMKATGPFKWSNIDWNVQHNGHPDIWNFDRVSPTWAWKHDNM